MARGSHWLPFGGPARVPLWTLVLIGFGVLAASAARPAGSAEQPSIGTRIDVNSADAAELAALPAIGPSLAEAVCDHRRVHGAFDSVEDLVEVSRVGPNTLERLRGWVTVDRP